MRKVAVKTSLVGILMLASSAMVLFLSPDKKQIENRVGISLESFIPKKFSDWQIDETVIPIMPSPELTKAVDLIYDETLARSYLTQNGERIMLTIAYGGDQTGRLRVHRPESCYSGAGFLVKNNGEDEIIIANSKLPVQRLYAESGPRKEPITYWIRVGNETVTGLIGQRIVQLKSGLTGEIPDGLIFRVSSINSDIKKAYALHDRFIADLLGTVTAEQKSILIGGAHTPLHPI